MNPAESFLLEAITQDDQVKDLCAPMLFNIVPGATAVHNRSCALSERCVNLLMQDQAANYLCIFPPHQEQCREEAATIQQLKEELQHWDPNSFGAS
jgi:hypothetical protein